MIGMVPVASGIVFMRQGNNVKEKTTGSKNSRPIIDAQEHFLGLEQGMGRESGILVESTEILLGSVWNYLDLCSSAVNILSNEVTTPWAIQWWLRLALAP